MHITEASLKRIELGNKQETILKDEKLTGFAVRVRRLNTGDLQRDFLVVWQETKDGKRHTRKVFIGKHGDPWSAEKAREEAQRLLTLKGKGQRVVNQRKAASAEKTIADLCDEFEKGHLPDVKDKTAHEYRLAMKKWIRPKLGKLRVRDLRTADVKEWLEKGRGTPIAANRAFAVLSRMMRYAIEREWRESNPCIGVTKFKEKARERWLNERELPAFINALADDASAYGDLLRFLTVTGWRVSEAIGLRWEMVDLDSGKATLPDTKTGGQVRALSADALIVVEGQAHRTGFVFSGFEGKRPLGYKQVREALRAVCESAGIEPIRPHDLRHTAASWAAIAGATAHELKELGGWKTLAMTARYVGRAEALSRSGAEKAAGAINIFRSAPTDAPVGNAS